MLKIGINKYKLSDKSLPLPLLALAYGECTGFVSVSCSHVAMLYNRIIRALAYSLLADLVAVNTGPRTWIVAVQLCAITARLTV